DLNGSTNYSLAGITQLQSVPYALSASPAGTAGGDLTGNYPSPSIANNAITGNKIADGSITDTKVVSVSAVKITGVLPVEKGGTGSATKNFVDLTGPQVIGGKKTFNDS